MNMAESIGYWQAREMDVVCFSPQEIQKALGEFRQQLYVIRHPSTKAIGCAIGQGVWVNSSTNAYEVLGVLPPIFPEWLGSRGFTHRHNIRFPYASGAMANGIATTDLVIAMSNMGGLGFFGAAGLSRERVSAAIDVLQTTLGTQGWGINLIHSPHEPELEQAIAEMYIKRRVPRVSAAAYMKLSPYIVRYALTGLRNHQGTIVRENQVFAKISRPETAEQFMSPAPASMVQYLLQKGWITEEEAKLAQYVSVAENITVEADSGGHTDNQALSVLFPVITQLRHQVIRQYGLSRDIYLGAAGGIGDPLSASGAFAMGADFILTGSINQSCVEAGIDAKAKKLLAQVQMGDVIMAPAADMFEMGVEVQVLKRGSMFGVRAKKLYEWYKKYASLWEIDGKDKQELEQSILRASVEQSWEDTKKYWMQRDNREVVKAEQDAKHQMALVFRSYLGLASRWAIQGNADRVLDYQIWCGPAMASFNRWVKGSFLEHPENRRADQVARNMLEGACQVTRAQQLRNYGVAIPMDALHVTPVLLQ